MPQFSPSVSFTEDIIAAKGQGRPQQCRLTPSFSMPDINGLGLSHTFGSIVSSWGPNLLSGSLLEHVQAHHPKNSTFFAVFSALRVQFSHLKRRIYGMEAENNELRHANMVLRSDTHALEEELSNFRADYYAERFQSKVRVRCARADKDKIIVLSDKLKQAENFIMAMVDIKLHEPVLGRAAEAVKEGADAEEALIEAVRAAANKKGSAWSRIIPAIVGPRSPEHYLSAINLALMLQKDLHEREKVSNFWKMIAKFDPVNANTITPSPSLLSEVAGQDFEHSMSEQAVLDEMIALLANGDILSRKNEFVQPVLDYSAEVVPSEPILAEDKILGHPVASIPTMHLTRIQPELAANQPSLPITKKPISLTKTPKTPKSVKIAGVSPPTQVSQIPVSPLRLKSKPSQTAQSKLPSPVSPPKVLSRVSPSKPVSPLRVPSKQPITPIRKAPLTPIRSRLSTPRTNTFKRPVLTSIDLNKPMLKMDISKGFTKSTVPANIPDDTSRKQATRDHSKDLVKRRGVIMEEIAHSRPSIVTDNDNIVPPMTAKIEMYEHRAPLLPSSTLEVHAKTTEVNNPASTLISQEDPIHVLPISPVYKEPSFHCTELDLSLENAKQGSLLAAQALQSLERICAAFSSDSLGSLEMTDAGTDYADGSQSELEALNERNSNAVPPASLSNLSRICEALLDLECSMALDTSLCEDANLSVSEGPPAFDPPRPWASCTPHCQHMPSTSAASSSSSSSPESISIPVTNRSKKVFKSSLDKLDESPTPTTTGPFKPSPTCPTDRFAKSLQDIFYKAVPPSQNLSLLPIKQNPKTSFQQPTSFGSSPTKSPYKPRSYTISTVSPLPPTLSTPRPETLSTTSPFKPRSNTISTDPPKSSTRRRSPRPERYIPSTKPRSNTITTTSSVSRSHTAKTISSSAKRRSNTLDSYLQVPNRAAKLTAMTRAVSSENDITAPTAAFMRHPDVKMAPATTYRATNSVAPLIPTWSPALNNVALSPTQYRNMLRDVR